MPTAAGETRIVYGDDYSVVVPAHREAGELSGLLGRLLDAGVAREQVLVLVDGLGRGNLAARAGHARFLTSQMAKKGVAKPEARPQPAITARQREIFEYLREKIVARGYGPTVREIGQHFGITSPNGVTCHLKALEKKGLISREAYMSRAIQLTETPDPQAALPLAGIIDMNAEKKRLQKAIEGANSDLAKMDAKLSNPSFIERAKEEAITEARERKAELEAEIKRFSAALKRLSDA